MPFLELSTGLLIILAFGLAMILITWFFTRHTNLSTEDFLMAGRKVPWWRGAASIAASWIWAPALFISSQMAYQLGLPGLFWFVFPNIIAVAIFIFLAPKIRERFPQGHTFPEYISKRLGDEKIHKIYSFGYGYYQLMAVAVQLFAGSSLIFLLTGIPIELSIILMAGFVFIYSWISGLRASIVTDVVQLGFIFLGLLVVIPMAINAAGGFQSVLDGIGGVSGKHSSIFDPSVAFSFGLVTSIGLIAGAIGDQQFWQRTFAFDKKSTVPGFLAGAVLFAVVPILLSTLGFIAAAPGSGIILPEGTDPSMIGVLTVATLLSPAFLILFFLMLLAGLSSTLDSGLNAFSSLWSVDIRKYKVSHNLSIARKGMLVILFLGLLVAAFTAYIPNFGLKQLWWILNGVGSALVVPTILSLYWDKLTARGALYGLVAALVLGLPVFIYGNFVDNTAMIVASAIFILAINIASCWLFRRK
jgi:SSS family transporter